MDALVKDEFGLVRWAKGHSYELAKDCMERMLENPSWRQDRELYEMYRVWVKKFGENFCKDLIEDYECNIEDCTDDEFDEDEL
jgi:hypothetical protein